MKGTYISHEWYIIFSHQQVCSLLKIDPYRKSKWFIEVLFLKKINLLSAIIFIVSAVDQTVLFLRTLHWSEKNISGFTLDEEMLMLVQNIGRRGQVLTGG